MPRDLRPEEFHVEVKHHCPLPNRYTWQIHRTAGAFRQRIEGPIRLLGRGESGRPKSAGGVALELNRHRATRPLKAASNAALIVGDLTPHGRKQKDTNKPIRRRDKAEAIARWGEGLGPLKKWLQRTFSEQFYTDIGKHDGRRKRTIPEENS
jgi:hypothetical protein